MKVFTILVLVCILGCMLSMTRIPKWQPAKTISPPVRIGIVLAARRADLAAKHIVSLVETAACAERLAIVIAHAPSEQDTDGLVLTRRLLYESVDPVLAASLEIRVALFPSGTSSNKMLLHGAAWIQPTETLMCFVQVLSGNVTYTKSWDSLVANDIAVCMRKRKHARNHGVVLQVAPMPYPAFAIRDTNALQWKLFHNPPYEPLPTIAVAPAGMLVVHGDDWSVPAWAYAESNMNSTDIPSVFWSCLCAEMRLESYVSGTISCHVRDLMVQAEAWQPQSTEGWNAKIKWEHDYVNTPYAYYGLQENASSADRRFKLGSSDQQAAFRSTFVLA